MTIGGTPTTIFSGTVVVTAIDANGCRTNAGYALSVICPPPPPQISAYQRLGDGSFKLTFGGSDALSELHLMIGEKVDAAVESSANLMAGASAALAADTEGLARCLGV